MKRNSVKKRALSVVLTLALLIAYFPIMDAVIPTVAAEDGDPVAPTPIELNISSGNITITNDGYTVGTTTTSNTSSPYLITGSSTNKNTITIDGYVGTVELNDVRISSLSKAPVLIQNDSKVTVNITGTCVFQNSGTAGSNKPAAWPALCIGDGQNTVTVEGDGTLYAYGGEYCPAIGGACSDSTVVSNYRTSVFNSTVTLKVANVIAEGGANAPNIGTGRGCDVTGGGFVFESGSIIATKDNGNSVGIGVCESVSLSNTVLAQPSFASDLTLSFTGATVSAKGGSNCAAIGAGNGQSAHVIVISGGSITATAGSNSPAIGNGNGGTGTPDIIISGGAITAKSELDGKSPIQGNVNISGYEDMSLKLDYTPESKNGVRIPYAEYTEADYITSGFSAESGTYYKSVVTNSFSTGRGKTCKYISISKCLPSEHKDVSTPSDDDPVYKHNGRCTYCDRVSDGVPHVWVYTKDGNTMTETCTSCGETHSVTVSDCSYIYDTSTKTVSASGIHATPLVCQYIPAGSKEPLEGAPTEVGTYTVIAKLENKTDNVEDVTVTVTLEIKKSPMDIRVTSPEYVYDAAEHSISLTVVDPKTPSSITYSTDGETFTSVRPKFRTVGKHPVFYKVEANNYDTVVGVAYVYILPKSITGLTIENVGAPRGGDSLDTEADCTTPGIAVTKPTIHWIDADGVETVGTAKFNTVYKCYMNIEPNREMFAFSTTSPCAVTVNGNAPSKITYNPDGSLTVYCEYDATAKAAISRVSTIADITVEHGAEKSPDGLGLPGTVPVTCDDTTITELKVEWDVSSCSYNESKLIEQTFIVNGNIVDVPDHAEFNVDVSSGTAVKVTVLAARTNPVTADPEASEYDEEKTIHLSTGNDGDTIYYTINGDDPFESATDASPKASICTKAGIQLTCEEGSSRTYRIQARARGADRRPSELFDKTYTITVSDKTAPTATITIGPKSWQKFLSDVTFGFFTTDKYTVKIDATDNCDATVAISYCLSDKALSLDELKSKTDWTSYPGEFDLSGAKKYIVYAKAEDSKHNVSYVNSEGLVIYTNSVASTTEVSVTPNVTKSVDFTVTLNGNTIDKISLPSGEISSDLYEVNVTNGTVTLKSGAFDTLSYGSYDLIISYKPQGVDYLPADGNTAPDTTKVTLKVIRPKVLSISSPAAITDVSNGTPLANIKLPATVGITTDPVTITEVDVNWDTDSVYSGSYDPNVLELQNFTLHGTVQLDADSIDLNGVSKDVYVEVFVNPANQLSKPVALPKGGSYANKVTVQLTSSDNADIYYTLDKSTPTTESTRYTGPLELTETTTIKAICHTDGRYDSDVMSVTYTIVFVDETAPTGSISIGKESFWNALWSGALYQFFTKNSQVVTISGKDEDSGIQAIFYYISPVELSKDELEQVTGWELYEEALHLDPNVGGIIYAKIVNKDDVYSYVNSNGIVIYSDAEAVTDSVTYVKGTNADITFTVKLNGNSIKSVRNGGTRLSPTQYSQSSDGNIVISASYLESLSTGNYTFYVDYYPLGINNSNASGGSVAPAPTSVKVLVSAKSTTPGTGSGSNQNGSSSSGSGAVIPPSSTNQNPDFEGSSNANTTTKTDSSGVKHEITTITYTDKSKTITDESTAKDGTITSVVTERNPKGATTNVATKVTTKDGTESYTVVEYVSPTQTKSTTNKVDKLGNSYERVYVTNQDGSAKETITSIVSDVKTTDNYKLSASGEITQTYKTTKELNGDIINVTVKGSGSQLSPTYTETYTLVEDGLDKCTINVKRTNSKAKATASVAKTNEAGNRVVISSELLADMEAAASWNDPNGQLPNVSTVHSFSSNREPVDGIDVTYKVLNEAGDKRYTLLFDSNDIVPGAKIRQFRYTDGAYVMLGANYKTVSSEGNLAVSPTKNYTYLLAGSSTYKSVNEKIKDSAVFASSSPANVSAGKSQYFKLSSKFNPKNIKSIDYKSKNGLIASVTDDGKVTAKRKGKTKITATIKFVNGGSKTITRTVNVK